MCKILDVNTVIVCYNRKLDFIFFICQINCFSVFFKTEATTSLMCMAKLFFGVVIKRNNIEIVVFF